MRGLAAVHLAADDALCILHRNAALCEVNTSHRHDQHQADDEHRQRDQQIAGHMPRIVGAHSDLVCEVRDDARKDQKADAVAMPFSVMRSPIHIASAVPAAMQKPIVIKPKVPPLACAPMAEVSATAWRKPKATVT